MAERVFILSRMHHLPFHWSRLVVTTVAVVIANPGAFVYVVVNYWHAVKLRQYLDTQPVSLVPSVFGRAALASVYVKNAAYFALCPKHRQL
jgi:hypothetical protein